MNPVPFRAPQGFGPDEAFARFHGSPVGASSFRAEVAEVAAGIATGGIVINLCEDRYRFLVAFAASLFRGTTTLLPASHARSAVDELIAEHPDGVLQDDASARSSGIRTLQHGPPQADFVAAIGHTSGSTGKPAAHAKTWSSLQAVTMQNAATLHAAIDASLARQRPWIVATVPPQHMYGLETSVLLPLLGGFGIHCGRPLLPADVATALAEVPAPRVLVSTPVHLRVLAESAVDFPEVAVVVSATAPLTQELAQSVERRLGAKLVEMFGSTETCVIATRRTAIQENWHPYPGIRLEPLANGTQVRAPWLPRPQLLQDFLGLRADGSFAVIGRNGDLVEVAGKRVSLADLTRRLAALPGVQDAHVFRPNANDSGRVSRCAALVVAKGLSANEVLRRLRSEVDPAFLPRPLVVVPGLPRNEVGKLSIDRAHQLLADALARRRPNRAWEDQSFTATSRPRRGR